MRTRARARRRWPIAVAAALVAAVIAPLALADTPAPPVSTPDTEYTPASKDGCAVGWSQVAGDVFPGAQGCGGYKQANSPVPDTVDFFTVAFGNQGTDPNNGFAGGAECADPNTPASGLDSCPRVPALWQYTDDTRGPLWTQVALPGGATGSNPTPGYIAAIAYMADGHVLAVGGDGVYPRREPCDPGDATAAIPGNPANVVACPAEDPAGRARAWLYDGSSWTELDLSKLQTSDTPSAPMAALTALDCSPRPSDFNSEFCVAGGLRQLWFFHDGRFKESFTPSSSQVIGGAGTPVSSNGIVAGSGKSLPSSAGGQSLPSPPNVDSGQTLGGWRFRIRAIKFVPGAQIEAVATSCGSGCSSPGPQVVAVTSGCCDANAYNDSPRILVWDGTKWHVNTLQHTPLPEIPGEQGTVDYWSLGLASGYDARGASPPRVATDTPDSYYGLLVGPQAYEISGVGDAAISVLQADGRPPDLASTTAGEPTPQFAGGCVTPSYNNSNAECNYTAGTPVVAAGSLRLVAADGDTALDSGLAQSHCPPGTRGACVGGDSDAFFLWAVGDFGATCQSPDGLDCQGAAYTASLGTGYIPVENGAALPQTGGYPDALACPGGFGQEVNQVFTAAGQQSLEQCKAPGDASFYTDQLASRTVYTLPGYELNAFASVHGTGSGWAVGDRGAIFSQGGQAAATAGKEPPAPALGSGELQPLPDRAAYSPYEPAASAQPGLVPPLRTQPLMRLPEPQFVPAGSPDPTLGPGANAEEVGQIAMSPDGAEGWAIGPAGAVAGSGGPPVMTLDHYENGRWTRCDSDGVPGVLAPDPACASLAAVRRFYYGFLSQYVMLNAIATIPTAGGHDLASANDFEAIAVGSEYALPGDSQAVPVLLLYKDGRWSVDAEGMRQLQQSGKISSSISATGVACGSPDDCWIVGTAMGTGAMFIAHFDGSRWVDCDPSKNPNAASACDDPGGRLPITDAQQLFLTQAGPRVYLYGSRTISNSAGSPSQSAGGCSASQSYPLIIYHDPSVQGGRWTSGAGPGSDGGGLDPGLDGTGGGAPNSSDTGLVTSLSVAQRSDGSFIGWATGSFGSQALASSGVVSTGTPTSLLELQAGRWDPYSRDDAAADYLGNAGCPSKTVVHQATLPDGHAFIEAGTAPNNSPVGLGEPLLAFDPSQDRWSVVGTPFWLTTLGTYSQPPTEDQAAVRAIAPDGHGGIWVAAKEFLSPGALDTARPTHFHTFFYDYRDPVPEQVFSSVAHPIRDLVTAATGGGDGSFWVATASNAVYRYDRIGGWERLAIRGWDPGQLQTNSSPAYAIAVGPDGSGVVVGKGGRIADLRPSGAILDPVAGLAPPTCVPLVAPCGTGRDLRAAAVAQDGSGAAMVGGEDRALLYRPPGGEFASLAKPQTALSATITAITLPSARRAWVSTDRGQVFSGALGSDGRWTWQLEDMTPSDKLLSLGPDGPLALRAIAVDRSGHGFAVGDDGLILERTGDPGQPWARLADSYLDDLESVALPAGGGPGALIGGANGLILTWTGARFDVAHAADPYDEANVSFDQAGSVPGLALLGGGNPGEVEAWAVEQQADEPFSRTPPVTDVLHYSSNASDPLLDGGSERVMPLPDTPAPRLGEIVFAAFGKSDCSATTTSCPELTGSGLVNERIQQRIVAAISHAAHEPGGPTFAVFTGDANDEGGNPAGSSAVSVSQTQTFIDESLVHRRWAELVAGALQAAGVPVYGALGSQDLSQTRNCSPNNCEGTGGAGGFARGAAAPSFGVNLPWRAALAGMPAPWGSAPAPSADGLSFVPVPDSGTAIPASDESIPGATVPGATLPVTPPPVPSESPGDGVSVGPSGVTAAGFTASPPAIPDGVSSTTIPNSVLRTGGARTHYAMDLVLGGRKVLRLVFVDSSLGSLTAGDGMQNPLEASGGQLAWLQSVICVSGSTVDTNHSCSRPAGEQAAVVSETPTYSYWAGETSDTLTDSTAVEQLLLANHVSLVVSGRLGANALFYTLAAGVHYPCPGGSYPTGPPAAISTCGTGAQAPGSPSPPASVGQLAQALQGAGVPIPADPTGTLSGSGTGLIPNVIAAGAGGKFGPVDNPQSGTASAGYWHGYTIIRLAADGNPAQTIVEQRPIFDWLGMTAIEHTLEPGQHLQLHGFGREPVGIDMPAQYDDINGPAITHRYDLLAADPQRPWLPLADPSSPAPDHYVPLDPSVATVDRETGLVQSGSGSHQRVYAVAILSVGDQAASWPLVFEPSRGFASRKLVLPQLPALAPPAPLAPVHLAAAAAAPPAPPSSAPPTPPEVATPNLPQLPSLSPPPPVAAVTPPAPPSPPAPPPPPSQPTPLPLALQAKLSPVGINATVVPPSPPPVNPAPPSGSGARKEAKQRQAATAKSEEGAAQARESGVDLANARPGGSDAAQMTRRTEPHPFTAARAAGQPSAWARELLYGGSLALAALILALGFTIVRPGPRRREPRVPAPAWNYLRRRL